MMALFLHRLTFEIVLTKIHRPSVNRFDGAIFLVRFDY